ncbi:unnamed protein product, partial [Ectocarpus sp. 13 AM-2016]
TKTALGLANVCNTDLACDSKCCSEVTTSWLGIQSPGTCQDKGSKSRGAECNTADGCDCEGSDICDDDDKECKAPPPDCKGVDGSEDNSKCTAPEICCPKAYVCGQPSPADPTKCACGNDDDCSTGCCANGECAPKASQVLGEDCATTDGCDCKDDLVCDQGKCK